MEPGHEDREDFTPGTNVGVVYEPQWSPAMKTGKTGRVTYRALQVYLPQWSPAMKTGKTARSHRLAEVQHLPQWSPAMKTGKTGSRPAAG